MCSISVWLHWGYIQVLLPAENEENYKSFQVTFHESLSSLHHFWCSSTSAVLVMLPSSLTPYISIEESPLFCSSPCEWALLFSPLCGSTELPPCAGLDCAWDTLPAWALLLLSIRAFFNISLPWFQGKQAMGEGKSCLSAQGCVLLLPQACPGAPLRLPIWVQWSVLFWGASVLGAGPHRACLDNNNVCNGLPGLKTVWIPCRSFSNSLSSWRAEPTETHQKQC